jgi:hypothetical protein
MGKELELIVVWKDAVEVVKNDVFEGDLTDREEGEDKSLYEEIEDIMHDEDDMAEIYEAFDDLKGATKSPRPKQSTSSRRLNLNWSRWEY